MKTVFSGSELAHVWAAQQQIEGKASNFYFYDKTIYSYSRHFPIATIFDDVVLFTKKSYSHSTAKHITRARQAVSHKKLIWCYEVGTSKEFFRHSENLDRWRKDIELLFNELGNKKNRNTGGRIAKINQLIEEVDAYCHFFDIKIKDKELNKLLKLASSEDFLEQARAANEKKLVLEAKKFKQAEKAYKIYLELWKKFDDEGISGLDAHTKSLIYAYQNSTGALTRLRYDSENQRLETSKGVKIPIEMARLAYVELNGCLEGTCKNLEVNVYHYTITETTKDTLIAGCHTIPKEDVRYIASLLNW